MDLFHEEGNYFSSTPLAKTLAFLNLLKFHSLGRGISSIKWYRLNHILMNRDCTRKPTSWVYKCINNPERQQKAFQWEVSFLKKQTLWASLLKSTHTLAVWGCFKCPVQAENRDGNSSGATELLVTYNYCHQRHGKASCEQAGRREE